MISSIADLAAGPAHSVPAMCNELAALGHRVEMHVLDEGGATARSDARYRLYAYPRPAATKRIGFSPSMLSGLREAARRSDLIHWHGLWMFPNVYPAWATRNTPCKLVASPRGTLEAHALERSRIVKRIAWSTLQGPAIRRAQLLHATSSQELASIRSANLRAPTALVENGIYLPSQSLITAARAARTSRRTLVYLGRLHPIKALDRILRAWHALERDLPEWDLTLIGSDSDGYLDVLRRLVTELKLSRVTFRAPVFGAERDTALASADLYVLASLSENFAMSVAEALACGIPVVCSKGAPWSGLVANHCGDWVENSIDELTHSLKAQMLKPREQLTEMGDNARTWMERDFAWSSKAAEMSQAYSWLLQQEQRTTPGFVYVR